VASELQEGTEEWLVDKEEASRQLGDPGLGRQHEQIPHPCPTSYHTDCQWGQVTCGTGGNQQQLLVMTPFAERATKYRVVSEPYTVPQEFCKWKGVIPIGIIIGIKQGTTVDMLMLETVTRLPYELHLSHLLLTPGSNNNLIRSRYWCVPG
jgi:hypothetical protein